MTTNRRKSIQKDIGVLVLFFDVFCSNRHKDREKGRVVPQGILKDYLNHEVYLCDKCRRQFLYTTVKRVICPFDPKLACKKCP
jgi:hypothetical protein